MMNFFGQLGEHADPKLPIIVFSRALKCIFG